MRRSKHYWGERERERERFHDALFHGTESARREPREPPRGMHPPLRVSLAPARSTPPSLRDSPSSSLQHRKSFHRVVLRVKCVEIEGRKKTKAIARDAPGAGFGANTPVSLSNIHDLGAFKRFKCFFGPRTMLRCLLLLLLLRALFVLGSFSFFFFFLCLELIKRSRKVPTKNKKKSLTIFRTAALISSSSSSMSLVSMSSRLGWWSISSSSSSSSTIQTTRRRQEGERARRATHQSHRRRKQTAVFSSSSSSASSSRDGGRDDEEEEEENEDKTRKDDASLSSESSSLFTSVREIDEYIVNPKEMITDVIDSDPNVLREIEKLKKESKKIATEAIEKLKTSNEKELRETFQKTTERVVSAQSEAESAAMDELKIQEERMRRAEENVRAAAEETKRLREEGVNGGENEEEMRTRKNLDRIESAKVGTISATGGVLLSLPLALSQFNGNAFNQFADVGATAVSCALFGIVYRYAVRENIDDFQLKGGVVGAFGLVRGFGQAEVFMDVASNNNELSFSSFAQAAAICGESVLVFLFAGLCVEAAMARDFVQRKSGKE